MIIIVETKYLAIDVSIYNIINYLLTRCDHVIHHDVVIISLINTHEKYSIVQWNHVSNIKGE